VERVIGNIDANNGNPGINLPGHDKLLVSAPLASLQSLTEREHDPSIPLTDEAGFPNHH
jgi:hypothetical protein